MQKQFSIIVPDELFVNDFSSNKTATFTYDGPETLKVEIQVNGDVIGVTNRETPTTPGLTYLIDLNPDEYPAAAYYLYTEVNSQVEYDYEDEINHDGSIYKKITNPRLKDYYSLFYNLGATLNSEDGRIQGPWEFKLIEKKKTTLDEELVQKNLDRVTKNLKDVALTTEDQALYDTFVSDCNTYLNTMANVYPWKYVTITEPAPPKVPVSLIKLINELQPFRGQ